MRYYTLSRRLIMWEYTDKVKEHFLNPLNVGTIEDADGMGEVGSLACGDALTLYFKLGDERSDCRCEISDVRMRQCHCFFIRPDGNA